MAIYPDKKGSTLTGRFRVEVQHKGQRARGRFDTLKEAQAKEREWLTGFKSGAVPEPATARLDTRGHPRTLKALIRRAEGFLWRGNASESLSFQRLSKAAGVLGDLEIEKIDTHTFDTLASKLSVSPATLNRYLSAFNQLLKWAQDRGYRTAALPRLPWERESEGRIRWITRQEERTLLDLLDGWERSDISDLVSIAIVTGMRRNEILKLEERDIEEGWVRLWKTKTDSPRSVPISWETYVKLLALVRGGMPQEHELRYWWDRAREAMGLKADDGFVFHATRHTCATRLVQANVNLRIIQRFMGHKRIETTTRYAQVSDNMLTDALDQLSQADADKLLRLDGGSRVREIAHEGLELSIEPASATASHAS